MTTHVRRESDLTRVPPDDSLNKTAAWPHGDVAVWASEPVAAYTRANPT